MVWGGGGKQSPKDREGERAVKDKHLKATTSVRVLNLGVRFGEGGQGYPCRSNRTLPTTTPFSAAAVPALDLGWKRVPTGQLIERSLSARHLSCTISLDPYSKSDLSLFCRKGNQGSERLNNPPGTPLVKEIVSLHQTLNPVL